MENKKQKEFYDYLILIAKLKKILLLIGFVTLISSYLLIYFFVDEQFESTAIIVPTESQGLGGISSIIGSLGNLPMGLGGALSQSGDIERYNTIVYSRSTIVEVIDKFDLQKEYDPESLDKTVKYFRKDVDTEVTEDNAFQISVKASSPQKSADITNYFVEVINRRIIDLNISKARDDKNFLEKRYNEVRDSLEKAEDSLAYFQEKSGVFLAEEQIKATIETFSKLEATLAASKVELFVAESLYGKESPKVKPLQLTYEESKSALDRLKTDKDKSNLLLDVSNIPQNALNYMRHYRNVQTYMAILEFLVPIYEQSKFEEKKATPILKIIDNAVPPEKKIFPPRILLAVIVTFFVLLLITMYAFWKQILANSTNPKLYELKKELVFFTSKKN